ncbi:MAG: type II secretion system protein [Elusimicrobiaceae bacterium]|nr:type II secretion system protein [Elusimicrobiaceae bacterium]
MKTNKGFSLAEMVAVIVILMIMAFFSTPYIKGYMDDSYNGKAIIYMEQLNEARLNFEKDYPGTTVIGTINPASPIAECKIETMYGNGTLIQDVSMLRNCKYLTIPPDILDRYTFAAGTAASCDACSSPVVSITGKQDAGTYYNKCACIDSLGRVQKQAL